MTPRRGADGDRHRDAGGQRAAHAQGVRAPGVPGRTVLDGMRRPLLLGVAEAVGTTSRRKGAAPRPRRTSSGRRCSCSPSRRSATLAAQPFGRARLRAPAASCSASKRSAPAEAGARFSMKAAMPSRSSFEKRIAKRLRLAPRSPYSARFVASLTRRARAGSWPPACAPARAPPASARPAGRARSRARCGAPRRRRPACR